MHTVQIQLGKGGLLGLFHQEGAAFQGQFHQLFVFLARDTAAFVAVFVFRIGVRQKDFGGRLLHNRRENTAVNRIFGRLRNQNQPAFAFAVGFEDFEHQFLGLAKPQRPPKLFNNAGQKPVLLRHFIHHHIAQMEHIRQYRCGRRVVVFENIGQIKTNTPKVVRVKQVCRIVQAPCKASVFRFTPFSQAVIQAVIIG